jgi:hypothetical protein
MVFGFYKVLSLFFLNYVFSHQPRLVLFIGFIATIVVAF